MSLVDFMLKNWRRLLLFNVAWTILVFVVLPRIPVLAQLGVYGAVIGYLAFTFGVLSERKRRLADGEEHIQELQRLSALMDEAFAEVRGKMSLDLEFRLEEILKKRPSPNGEELN